MKADNPTPLGATFEAKDTRIAELEEANKKVRQDTFYKCLNLIETVRLAHYNKGNPPLSFGSGCVACQGAIRDQIEKDRG